MSKLSLVPTPVGNLGDITLRAIEVLKESDMVLVEDSRVSGKLLKHLNISKPLYAYHQHNEHKQLQFYIDKIKENKLTALITDAGTPAISDPGFLLVRECISNNIEIECLPGATAFVPALVISGFPNNQFVFEGFLPHKKGRQTRMELLSKETRTIVLYESCHRILKLVASLCEYLSKDRQIAVCKEISKLHETVFRGTASEVHSQLKSANLKGEFVVVIGNE